MIVSTPEVAEVKTNVVGNVIDFSIKASSHSFKILSSTLYANSIRAIIRELSCNALDSHAMAKNAEPFEVHLPSALEPWFYVKDFGTGLSSDEVVNIYTTYFSSTKTNDNMQIGALGLGSKSPFAYSDNFTITTTKDGWRGIYSALINEEGVPGLLLLSEGSTDEPNGVEVRMCVQSEDFGRFEREAIEVFRYFSNKPRVVGKDDFVFRDYHKTEIIPNVYYNEGLHIDSVVVMGNIPYPIDFSNLDCGSEFSDFFNLNYIIEVPIGAVDFQPSREGLKYTSKTQNTLNEIFNQLEDGLKNKLISDVDAIPHPWKKADYLCGIKRGSIYRSILGLIADSEFEHIVEYSSWRECYARAINLNIHKVAEEFNIDITRYVYDTSTYNGNDYCEKNLVNPLSIEQRSTTCFIVNKENIKTYLKYYALELFRKDHGLKQVLVISPLDKNKEMDIDGFLKECGNPPEDLVVPISTITPNIPKRITSTKPKTGAKLYSWNGKDRKWDICDPVEEVLKDCDESDEIMVYVPFEKNEVGVGGRNRVQGLHEHYDGGIYYDKDLHNYYVKMQSANLKVFDITVWGVPNKALHMIKDNPNWIELKDYVKEEVANITKENIIHVWQSVRRYNGSRIFEYNKAVLNSLTNKDNLLAKTMILMEDYDDSVIDKTLYSVDDFTSWYVSRGGTLNIDDIFAEMDGIHKEILKQYPLLDYCDRWRILDNEHNQRFVDYINMMDKMKENNEE